MLSQDKLADIETANLRQIQMLNQRGGRTLSIVDVMRAGTITPEAAGFLLWRIAHGASFLTGAVPGGAGKSTLLADMLGMLPPGERIVTTPDERAIFTAFCQRPRWARCYLCHEIGPGYWYGYLWGPAVASFFDLATAGGRIAACLHADDPAQVRQTLLSAELKVTTEQIGRIGVMLFMAFDHHGTGKSRIVDSIWTADGSGSHVVAYWRSRHSGKLVETESITLGPADGYPTLETCQGFMDRLLHDTWHLFEDVREAVIEFYQAYAVP
ncbi:MAG: hypothetical protein ACUVX8_18200 [Candidatus Zipacnadales bacterium]